MESKFRLGGPTCEQQVCRSCDDGDKWRFSKKVGYENGALREADLACEELIEPSSRDYH
jgi:hypothetical protein